MAPKSILRNGTIKACEHQRQAARKCQVANAPETEGENSIPYCRDISSLVVESGVCHAKTLRHEGYVEGDGLNHFVDVHLLRALAKSVAEGSEQRRHGWKVAQLSNTPGQDFTRDWIHFSPCSRQKEQARLRTRMSIIDSVTVPRGR